MRIVKKFFFSENFVPIIVVFLFALLAGRSLLAPGYFNMHDDLQMMRQLEMEKCLLDLQIPCRWVPDMGYGFGFPLFNFYPPLPYLIGEIIRLFGFSFVTTAKLLFLLSFVVSGLTMYFLAKEFFGRLGGIASAIFYIWAPYHSVDVFVRGAMNEAWALAWFPLILWTAYRLIQDTRYEIRWLIGLSLSWFVLLTSHNLMVLIFMPVFGIWCLIFLLRKRFRQLPFLVGSGILALGSSAFFSLPAILEQGYVHVSTLVVGYYEYIAHYVTLSQLLFSRFWGYGPSVWGEPDGMPFQIGHVHWILSVILLVFLLVRLKKTKKLDTLSLISFFFLAVGWFSAFMAHSRSTPIWQAVPLLKFVQFPWRFLTLTTLSFSFLVGAAIHFIFKRKLLPFIILVSLVLFLNWNYFRPERMGPLTDNEKLSGAAWELQQTAGIFDYLPKSAKENPKEPRRELVEFIEGSGEILAKKEGTDWAQVKVKVESESSLIRIGIFDFPIWGARIDRVKTEINVPESEVWGRMYLRVPKGEHNLSLELKNTPVRSVANTISLVTWSAFIAFPLVRRKVLK